MMANGSDTAADLIVNALLVLIDSSRNSRSETIIEDFGMVESGKLVTESTYFAVQNETLKVDVCRTVAG